MRKIDLIVIHCSATREDRCFTEFDLDVCHRRRGFNGPGYHFYIRKDGLDARGRPKDTRTEWQVHSMRVLVKTLLKQYPGSRVCGHRDLSPDLNANGEIEPEEWIKQCPCFNVIEDKKLH